MATFQPGARVRIRHVNALRAAHMLDHARRGDAGVVVAPSGTLARLTDYVLVQFDGCGRRHRLLPDELQRA